MPVVTDYDDRHHRFACGNSDCCHISNEDCKSMIEAADIYRGIDLLAERLGKKTSSLAASAGLDPTSFISSKRTSGRWPSTETIARVLNANGMTLMDYAALVEGGDAEWAVVPSISLEDSTEEDMWVGDLPKPNAGGVHVPKIPDASAYAIEITNDALEPYFTTGDIIVISPSEKPAIKSRVLVVPYDKPAKIGFATRIGAKQVHVRTIPSMREDVFELSKLRAFHKIALHM